MHNLPNILSLSRLISTVLVFLLVLINQPWAFLGATLLFMLASITDFFDGYLARRFNAVSALGFFLDLTADKIFVSAVFLALVQISLVPAWKIGRASCRERV